MYRFAKPRLDIASRQGRYLQDPKLKITEFKKYDDSEVFSNSRFLKAGFLESLLCTDSSKQVNVTEIP